MGKRMRALRLFGAGDLRYDEVPVPVPQAGEVLLRVGAAGICGSDIPRVFETGTYHFPTIIGHEFAGDVVAAAEGEPQDLVGRRAAVIPLLPCGHCAACAAGRYAQCAHYGYYGSRQDGGMAEYLAVRRENLCLLPPGVSLEAAAMCEPTAVAHHAFLLTGVQPGEALLLYGVGTITMLIAQWAKAAGIFDILFAARSDEKVVWAETHGFPAYNLRRQAGAQALAERLAARGGASACIEGTGASEGLATCLSSAKAFGTVVTLGNPQGEMRLAKEAYWQILRKEIVVRGTWNSRFAGAGNDWDASLQAMADGRIQPQRLITHRFHLSEYQEAFSLMHEKRELYGKVMFVRSGEGREA